MSINVVIYSRFGAILVHLYSGCSSNTDDIDLTQLYRFMHSCFTFSKCNVISSYFNGSQMISIQGTYSFMVFVSTKQSSLKRQEFICNAILYCFETSYHDMLQKMNTEQSQITQNENHNYTVHDIDCLDSNAMKQNKYYTKFILFQYFIDEFIKSNSTMLDTEIMSDLNTMHNFGIMLTNISHKTTQIIYEHSNHVIGFDIKQFVVNYCNTHKHKEKQFAEINTWSGTWRILSCKVKLWCNAMLFLIEKHPHCSDHNMIHKIKDRFENIVFSHDTQRILKHIEKFKPQPPALKKDLDKMGSFSRKRRYEKKIINKNKDADEDELNLVVIPSLPLKES